MHGWRSFSDFNVSRHRSWGNLVALRARKEAGGLATPALIEAVC